LAPFYSSQSPPNRNSSTLCKTETSASKLCPTTNQRRASVLDQLCVWLRPTAVSTHAEPGAYKWPGASITCRGDNDASSVQCVINSWHRHPTNAQMAGNGTSSHINDYITGINVVVCGLNYRRRAISLSLQLAVSAVCVLDRSVAISAG